MDNVRAPMQQRRRALALCSGTSPRAFEGRRRADGRRHGAARVSAEAPPRVRRNACRMLPRDHVRRMARVLCCAFVRMHMLNISVCVWFPRTPWLRACRWIRVRCPLCIGRGMHARGMPACGRRSAVVALQRVSRVGAVRRLAAHFIRHPPRVPPPPHAREHTHAPASSACAHTQVRRVGARAAGWTATRSRGGRGAYPRATAAVLQCCVYCRGTESTDAYGAKASTAARQTRAANAVTRRRPAVATCGCVSVFGDEGTGGAREGRGVGAAAGARGADVCTRMAECGVCVQAREQLREAYTAFARVEHCSFAEFTRVRTNHRVPTEYR